MSREAVIVSSARTGLAKSGRGGFNIPMAPPWADMPLNMPLSAPISSRRSRRCNHGLWHARRCDGPKCWSSVSDLGRLSGNHIGRNGQSLLFIGLQTIAMAAGRVLNEEVPVA